METRPRIVVTTDITSIRADEKEPDDAQSLVRLLSMSDAFEIEGLIASSQLRHGDTVRTDYIAAIVKAYAQVRPQLARHSRLYPTARQLLSCIKAGQPLAGRDLPPEASLAEDTAGSDWIIRCLQRDDPRPMWVIAWGGTADLAQALWRMRESLPAAEARKLRRKLRVYAIADQDSTGEWIRAQFPDVFYILCARAFRGIYRFGDASLCDSAWVRENVIEAHGPLGAAYPDYQKGDIYTRTLGPVRGTKEGDTPSFLCLFPNGLNVPERPDLGGWGGRFASRPDNPRQFFDVEDDVPGDELQRNAATVFRWREAFQREFAARMDRCVLSPRDCTQPPIVVLKGAARRRAKRGDTITLDVSQSRGTEGGGICCRWFCYPPPPGADVECEHPAAAKTRATINSARPGDTLHLVAEVTGAGTPAFTRYARVEVLVTG